MPYCMDLGTQRLKATQNSQWIQDLTAQVWAQTSNITTVKKSQWALAQPDIKPPAVWTYTRISVQYTVYMYDHM